MLTRLIPFVLDLFPFVSRQMLLVLPYYSTDGFAPNFLMIDLTGKFTTYRSMNSLTRITKFIASFTPMITTTVELVDLFSACLIKRILFLFQILT